MKKNFLKLLLSLFFCIICTTSLANTKKNITPTLPAKKIRTFVQHMVKKYGFNKTKLSNIMKQAKYNPKVITAITYPFEKKPWNFYRSYFLSKDRIEGGAQYWKTHVNTLNAVKAKYGVAPKIIVAIIAIESKFGRYAGNFNTLNTLYTLSFYYPPRSKFFKKELEHYLVFTRNQKLPTLKIQGSYAGALGIPQFMPSSYRHYGVHYANTSSIDLMNNHDDAIASIANYLKHSGWKLNQPIAVPAKIIGKVPKKLLSNKVKLKYTLKQLAAYKVDPVKKTSPKGKVALIAMHNAKSTEYWIVFRNFRAIMLYNPRTTYSLAVYELGQAIKKAYEQQTKTSTATTPTRTAQRS